MSRFRTVAGRLPRWAWLVAACLAGGCVAWACWPQRPPDPVDGGFRNANLSGAETQAEFEVILGPPGRYGVRGIGYRGPIKHFGPWPTGQPVEWADDYVLVKVWFGADGRRTHRWTLIASHYERTTFERLGDRIRDLWR